MSDDLFTIKVYDIINDFNNADKEEHHGEFLQTSIKGDNKNKNDVKD